MDRVRASVALGELTGMTLTDFEVSDGEVRLCFEDAVVVISEPLDVEVR